MSQSTNLSSASDALAVACTPMFTARPPVCARFILRWLFLSSPSCMYGAGRASYRTLIHVKTFFSCCSMGAEQQEEAPDPTQNAMLKDIHLQQAAGITEMIQGVKDNLMQMQTLKNRDGQADAGLEIFNKIGGGGFGEVFKGKYKAVRAPCVDLPPMYMLRLYVCEDLV